MYQLHRYTIGQGRKRNENLLARVFLSLSAHCVLPSPPEDPAKTLFPSLRVTVVALATFEPSFAKDPFTVTVSPIFREFRDQPRRSNPAVDVNSISQFATLPLASFASMKKRACGLIHSTFVTGPVSVAGLLRSNCAANEWCELTGMAAKSSRDLPRELTKSLSS